MSNLENVEKLIGGVVMSFIWHKAECLQSQGLGIGQNFIDEITRPSTIRNLSLAIIKQDKKLKKEKKDSRLKDPNASKKPSSSYMFFCKEKRAGFKSQNPEMKQPELSKLMGAEWRQLSEKKKNKYILKADNDKLRYLDEMKTYERPSDDLLVNRKKSGKEEHKTAYALFCRDKRAEVKKQNPEMTLQEVNSELERLWSEFESEEADEPWVIEYYINKKMERDCDDPTVVAEEDLPREQDLVITEDLLVESNPNKKYSKNVISSESD